MSEERGGPRSGELLIAAIHSLSQNIMRLYSQIVFRETGLYWQDWRILRAVVGLQSCRAHDICAESGLKKAHVSNGLARLEKAGHVARIDHVSDARSKLITCTAQGKDLVKEAQPALTELEQRLRLGGMDVDPAKVLEGLNNFKEELDRAARQPASKPG